MPKDFEEARLPHPVRKRMRKLGRVLQGAGGGKAGGGGEEADNTLRTRQIVRTLELLCEGPIKSISSPYLNKTKLVGDDGTLAFKGVTYQTRLGLPDQPPVEDMDDQTSETSLDILVRDDAPGTFSITDPDTDAAKVTVRIPSLWKLDDEGNMQPTDLSYSIEYKPFGSPSWISAMGSPFVLEKEKCTSNVYLDHRVVLTGASPWEVRVSRITPDNESDSKLQNDLYLSGYGEIINQRFTYPNSALLAIKADAEQFGNRVPERAVFVEGMICEVPVNYDVITRTYSGIWNGLFKQDWTDDPAWCLRNMVKNKRFGMARYVRSEFLSDAMLYGISQYCSAQVSNGMGGTEPRFTFNAVISSRQEAYDVLNAMVSAFRGMIYWSAGTAMIVQDSPREPSMLVTKANVIGGKFTRRGADLKTQHNRINVSYNNPDKFYERDIIPVDDPGDHIARFGLKPTDIVAFACSSVSQAIRAGRWLMYTERMEGEILTYIGGQDHHDVQPGDVHRVVDPGEIGLDFGGRVAGYTTNTITLDRPVTLDLGVQYQITVHDNTANRALHDRLVTGTGVAQTTYTVPVALPPMTTNPFETVWAIRKAVGQDTLWSVLASREVGPLQYEITCLRHDPSKFALIEEGLDIPEFPAPLLPTGALGAPTELGVVMSLENAPGSASTSLASITFRPSTDTRIAGYELHYRLSAGAWSVVNIGRNTNYEMRGIPQGTRYTYRVRAYDGVGQYSGFSNAAVTAGDSYAVVLAGPTPVSVTPDIKSLLVKWINPVVSGFDATEVWYAASFDLFAAVRAGESSGSAFTIAALNPNVTYHTWVRARAYGSPAVTSAFVYMGGQQTKPIEPSDISTAFETILDDLEAGGILNYATFPATGRLNQIIMKTPEMVLYRWDGTAWVTSLYANVQPASLGIASFAAGLEPVGISTAGSLPTVKTTNALMWQSKLYRWNGTAYVASVPTTDLAGTLTSTQIGTGSVLAANLAANAVTVAALAADAVTAAAIATGAVTATKIADATLTTAKFAAGLEPVGISSAGVLPTTKTTTALVWQNNLYRWNGTAYVKSVATADLLGTIAEANLASIAASKITGQLTDTQIADLDAAKLAGTLSPNRIGTGAILSAKLADAAISTAKIADGALSLAKFATGLEPVGISSAGVLPTVKTTETIMWQSNLYRWNGTAYVKSVAAADIAGTIAEANLASIAASKVTGQLTNTQIADLDAAKLAGTLSPDRIGTGAILASKIADAAITNVKIADAAVSVAKFASGLTPVEIVSALPTSGNYAGRTVYLNTNFKLYRHMGTPTGSAGFTVATDGADIVANSITAGQIAAGAITATEIAAGAITATRLAIGDTSNIYPDSDMVDTTAYTGDAFSLTANSWGSSKNVLSITSVGGTIDKVVYSPAFAVDGLLEYQIANKVGISGSGTTTARLDICWYSDQAATTLISQQVLRSASSTAGRTVRQAAIVTAPAGTRRAKLVFVRVGNAVTSSAVFNEIVVRRAAAGELIVDGGITAAKIAANTITANQIFAGTITATQLASDSVTAIKIIAGAITTGKIAAGTITASEIAAGTITATEISSGAITTAKLAAGAVTALTIAANTITASQIAAGTITATEILANTITAAKIAVGTITATEIASAAITAVKIAANTITAGQIAANTITAAQIAVGTITANEIATNAITAIKIIAGAITTGKIAANAVTANEIAAGTITATEIASGAISTAKLAAGAVTALTIAANTITAAQIAVGTITANELAANSITTAKIAAGAVTATEIAAGAILASKITVSDFMNVYPDFDFMDTAFYSSSLGTAYTFAGTGSVVMGRKFVSFPAAGVNVMETGWFPVEPSTEYRAVSSAWLVSAVAGAGTVTVSLQFGSVDSAGVVTATTKNTVVTRTDSAATGQVAVNLVSGSSDKRARFVMDTTGGSQIARSGGYRLQKRANASLIVDGTITALQIAANTITAANIAAGTITAAEIAASTITAAKIASATITATQIAAGAITATQIAADAVTTVKILAGSITAGTIATDAVTSAKILANSITTAKIAAGAVTATEIAAQAIVASKLLISDFANVYPDFNMLDAAFYSTINGASIAFSGVADQYLGQKVLTVGANAAATSALSGWFTIESGVEYQLAGAAWMNAAGTGTAALYFDTAAVDALGAPGSVLTSTLVATRTNLGYPGNVTYVSVVTDATARVGRFSMRRVAGGAAQAVFGGLKVQKKGTGALIVDGSITANNIAAGTITASLIAAGTITATQLATGAVTAVKIAAGTITTDKLAVTGMALVGGTLQSTSYTPGSVGWQIKATGEAEFNTLSVRTSMIVAGAVTTVARATQNAIVSITSDSAWVEIGRVTIARTAGCQTDFQLSVLFDGYGNGLLQLGVFRGVSATNTFLSAIGYCVGGRQNNLSFSGVDADVSAGSTEYVLKARRDPSSLNGGWTANLRVLRSYLSAQQFKK